MNPGSPKVTDSAAERALRECEARLRCVIDLSSDFYWEQDENLKFTVAYHREAQRREHLEQRFLGRTRWEIGGTPEHGTWDQHKALLNAHSPFDDFVMYYADLEGSEHFVRISGRPVFGEDGGFLGYRGTARDITNEKRDARLLHLERTVSAILSEANDATEPLIASIRAICVSEGWEAGTYWSLDKANQVLRFDSGWSIATEAIAAITREAKDVSFEPGIGLAGTVWQTGTPLWVSDLSTEPRVIRRSVAERTGWNSALLCPVFAQTEVIGVLDFNARRIPEPDDRLLRIVQLLGMQIGNFYERAMALARLRESEERFASTVELAAIGIGHVSGDGRLIHVNRQFCEMLGYTRDELLGLTVKEISHPDDADVTDRDRARLRADEIKSFTAEKRYIRKDGTPVWVRVTVATKPATDGTHDYDISIVEDISDRKEAEARVQYLATHDEMTGLPNRVMFGELLHHTIESARRHARQCAVLFIDLDRFKIVNDSLGHAAGDQLLKEVSSRILARIRGSDVVARLGGDEFVVLLEEIADAEDASDVARKILGAVLDPIDIMGHECRVTASIGIARYPSDASDAAALMRHADIAMYHAKEEGKNNFQFYSKEASPMSVERLALEAHLRRALEHNEFSLQYQAKVDLKTGEITGVEALLRWWNHELGTISPAHFIPIAEETGLIVPIGKWVLQTACEQNVAWQRCGLRPVVMAVNLSPRQFRDGRLLDDIAEVLAQTHMAPELLELEITESMLISNLEQAVEKARAIKNLGVRLAIDDFGTGYSSLSQLKKFPIDTLKVDRSFVRDLPANTDDMAITEAIIAMGRTLGVTVVAEGVETAAQQAFLAGRACDQMQGFYFSEPCHPDAFASLLDDADIRRAVDGSR